MILAKFLAFYFANIVVVVLFHPNAHTHTDKHTHRDAPGCTATAHFVASNFPDRW